VAIRFQEAASLRLEEIYRYPGKQFRGNTAWRLPPSDFPPWQTVYRWFPAFRDSLVFKKLNRALVMADREQVGRDASPSAAIIVNGSVKTIEAGGPRGYDAGKKINGRRHHSLVDTNGRLLLVEPHPTNIQDRDGGGALLEVSRALFPFIEHVWADGRRSSRTPRRGSAPPVRARIRLFEAAPQSAVHARTPTGNWRKMYRKPASCQ
jgi:transposase